MCPASRAAEAAAAGAIYTCPMHPQIRQVGPGACPICGMALEPLVAGSELGPNPELSDMSRRLWIALALTVPVFELEMGSHFFDLAIMSVSRGRTLCKCSSPRRSCFGRGMALL
jgi:Cu+-exporting ATPase